MSVTSHFGFAQSPGIGLHRPTSFGRVEWQPRNVLVEKMAINI